MVPLKEAFLRHVCQTSDGPIGLELIRARSATLETSDGRSYIDFLAGIGVNLLGHAHPEVVEAIRDQSDRYLHAMVYGEYVLEPQVRLAERLAGLAPGDLSVVYFTNSGTEANEGALKTARKYTGRRKLVAFHGSYHGDTCGSLSVTGRQVYRVPFEPLLADVEFLDFGDFSQLERIDHSVAGVIVEPIQGEGGVRIPPVGWLQSLRSACSSSGALLIFDEVQTGLGRTGRLWAGDHWEVAPDLLVLAKALGGGMPLGAFIGSPDVMATLSSNPPLAHVTTFGGHPVCCAAGLAALEIITRESVPALARERGLVLSHRIRTLADRFGGIREVRGRGLLIGVEFTDAAITERFAAAAFRLGLIVGWTLHSNTVLRLCPPALITDLELETGMERFEAALIQAGA